MSQVELSAESWEKLCDFIEYGYVISVSEFYDNFSGYQGYVITCSDTINSNEDEKIIRDTPEECIAYLHSKLLIGNSPVLCGEDEK